MPTATSQKPQTATETPSTRHRAKAPRQKRDPVRSRMIILEAATTEFARNGLGGARVDEIAERAGVNKALLYHYFGNKEALFVAVLELAYQRIRGAEAELDLEPLPATEAMTALVDFTFQYFLDHPDFIHLLNAENFDGARHLEHSHRVRSMHPPLVERIQDLLDRGAATGEFREGVDALQLYISIAALGYFYFSNAGTLGSVFGRVFRADDEVAARRQHVQSVVHGYLRSRDVS
jgi:TetR/AcrR family transcriptional regulator